MVCTVPGSCRDEESYLTLPCWIVLCTTLETFVEKGDQPPTPRLCLLCGCRKAQDGSELLCIPLEEALLRGVLEDLDHMA